MPDFGYGRADQPALDELARTDLLLDALAHREDTRLDDPHDDALAALLGDWRDDLRWPPASALVSQEEAMEALRAGVEDRGRGRRSMAAVGSVAATLLVLSGFGAVVAEARPGDLLYGLHAMMFNEPRVSDDQIVLSAKADLAKVQQLISEGQWTQAQDQLAEVSTTLQAVNDGGRRQDLLDQVNQLNTKVEKHDANATAPPSALPRTQLPASQGPPRNSLPPLAPQTRSPAPPAAIEPPTQTLPATNAPTAPSSPIATPVPSAPSSVPPAATTPSTTPPSPSRTPSASPTPSTTAAAPSTTESTESSPSPTTTKKTKTKGKPPPSSVAPPETPPTTPAAAGPSGKPPGTSPATASPATPSGGPTGATTNPPSPAGQASGKPAPKPPAATSTAP